MLQLQTGTSPDLGSVASITHFILALPPHLFQPFFWIALFNSSILPPPSSVTVRCRITSIYFTHYPHTILALNTIHLNVVHTRQPPAPPSQLCTPLRVPASAAVSRVRLSPLFRPQPAPRSLSSPGGFICCGYLCLLCASTPPSLCSDTTPGIFWLFISCRVAVFARG